MEVNGAALLTAVPALLYLAGGYVGDGSVWTKCKTGRPTEVVQLQLETTELQGRVAQVVAAVQRATFTGKGDKEAVPKLYQDYVER